MNTLTSDQIREYVRQHYVEPARHGHKRRFSVRCGTVEKELGLLNSTNRVCTALKSARKFLEPNGLNLVETSGPTSGAGRNVVYTYEFRDLAANAGTAEASDTPSIYPKLRQMEGILKHFTRNSAEPSERFGTSGKATRDEPGLLGHHAVCLRFRRPLGVQVKVGPNRRLLEFKLSTAEIFAELRGRVGVSSGDAIHLACAAEARVDLFLTHDKRLAKKIVPGIQFVATLDSNIL